jgi:predicted phosphodiesterase
MKLGVITDIHLYPDPNTEQRFAWHNPYPIKRAMAQYDAALERCKVEAVDAVVILGDIAHIGDYACLEAAIERAAAMGKPVWVVPGNHDCTVRADAVASAVSRHGHSRVTLLDTVGERNGVLASWRVAGLPIASDNGGNSMRALEQLALEVWLDDPVLFLTHFPMLSLVEHCATAGLKYAGDLSDFSEMTTLLHQRIAPTLVLHGHLHVRDELAQGSMLQLSFAALIEPPHEMAILELVGDAGELTIHRRNISIASYSAEQLPVLARDETRWQLRDKVWREL